MSAKAKKLIHIVKDLSQARTLDHVMKIVRTSARELVGSDGATFILKDVDKCFYADEDAMKPLWKGQRFPMEACISGWSMLNKKIVVIEDVFVDPRIPVEAYRPTFVKSLAMVPIRQSDPIGAIGNYWSRSHVPSDEDLELLQALADSVSVAMENVQLYSTLEKQVHELSLANTAKDEFLTILSHELRTPLNAILGWSKLLLEQKETDSEEMKTALTSIERNGSFQLQIVDDLLDTSRLIGNRLSLEKKRLDLNEALQTSIHSCEVLAAAKNISITCNISNKSTMVMGDFKRLQQIFTKIIGNAIKFTPKGGQIQIILDTDQGFSRVRIIDNGMGIHAGFLPHVFERFKQADSSSTRSYGGLGLGLSIAKSICELHGGHMTVESAGPGRGSTFTTYFPMAIVNLSKESMQIQAKTQPLNQIRVLVVDDSIDVLDLVRTILQKSGAEVQTFDSAKSAFPALAGFQPQIVISDLSMPEEDGFTFMKKIRSSGLKTPCVALTAFNDKTNESQAFECGFNSFLTKPLNSKNLIQTIEGLLST